MLSALSYLQVLELLWLSLSGIINEGQYGDRRSFRALHPRCPGCRAWLVSSGVFMKTTPTTAYRAFSSTLERLWQLSMRLR